MPQTFDLDAASAILKEQFPEGSKIWDQFNRKQRALDLTESTTKIPFNGTRSNDGRYWKIPLATKGHPNPAVPMGEGLGLPNPGATTLDYATFNKASLWQAMEFTGDVLDTVEGGSEAVTNALMYEMRKQPMDAGKEMNRMMHSDSSGVIAVPSAIASGNELTVDSTARVQVGRECVLKGDATGTLYTGQTSGTALKVSAVNESTGVITVTDEDDNAVSLTNDASLTGYSLYAYPGVQGGAINGFATMCDVANPSNWGSGTPLFGNINRSTNSFWQGYQTNAGGGTVSIQSHIQPHINRMKKRAGQLLDMNMDGADPGVMWYAFCGYENFAVIGNALAADQRTQGRPATLRGGYSGIIYNGAAFVEDEDAPPTRIRFIHYGSMRRHIIKNWFWQNRTGSIWKWSTANDGRDADVYRARMYTRQQNFVVTCLTMGEIYNTSATF